MAPFIVNDQPSIKPFPDPLINDPIIKPSVLFTTKSDVLQAKRLYDGNEIKAFPDIVRNAP